MPSYNLSFQASDIVRFVAKQQHLSTFTDAIDYVFAKAGYFDFTPRSPPQKPAEASE